MGATFNFPSSIHKKFVLLHSDFYQKKHKKSFIMEKQLEEKNTEMGNVITRTEEFIQKNQKKIIIIVCAIIAVALIIFCYFKFYKAPREEKAAAAVFYAENYFDAGDYQQALEGDGQNPGFLAVIDNYGSTKSGKLAKLYAGIASLRLGKFDEAANTNENDLTSPSALVKAGLCYLGVDNAKAIELFKQVKTQYPTSTEFTEVDKYLGLAEAK